MPPSTASQPVPSAAPIGADVPVEPVAPSFDSDILTGRKLVVVFSAMMLSLLLVSLGASHVLTDREKLLSFSISFYRSDNIGYVSSSIYLRRDSVFDYNLVVATALPRIASDFNAFTLQVSTMLGYVAEQLLKCALLQGWVSTSFVMTQTATLLQFGAGLRIWRAKHVLLAAIGLFELGSLLCGVAPNITALIVGRAISGVGAAGMVCVFLT